jgi:hypothetical protein
MTKRDYEKAAEICQDWNGASPDNLVAVNGKMVPSRCVGQYIMDAYVQLFHDDSPRFDEARFRAACVPGARVNARPKRASGSCQ